MMPAFPAKWVPNFLPMARPPRQMTNGAGGVVFGNGKAHAQRINGCCHALHQQRRKAHTAALFRRFPVPQALQEHLAADPAQQHKGNPGNEPFKGAEMLHNGVDAQPAQQRHQRLKHGKHTGHRQHFPPRHLRLAQAIG